ncbi:MAG: hypothetical protein AAFO94_15020 [Bacteroidota bacterium]
MRQIIFSIVLLFIGWGHSFAQAPERIKFQAIARNADGSVITTPIEVRLSVLAGAGGTPYYVDEQTTEPNDQGLFTLFLGDGPVQNKMSSIRWSNGTAHLKVEIKTSIGGDWTLLSEAPMTSVPYALYGEDEDADASNELQKLTLNNGQITLSKSGGSVDLPIAKQYVYTLPALALNYNPSSTIITADGGGLTWSNSFSNSANIIMHKPANYAGGSVFFRIFYRTTSSTAGNVQFFIRPRSFSNRDGLADAPSIAAPLQAVSGTVSFATLYEQEIKIPADRLSKNWWMISIQRSSTHSNSYPDDLTVFAVALIYDQY